MRIVLALWLSLGSTGCSALTAFSDLEFDDGADAGTPDEDAGEPTDARSGTDARMDAVAPPVDGGGSSDARPPTDGRLPGEGGSVDAGPPPMDSGPRPEAGPFDVGPPPADTSSVDCLTDADCDDREQCTSDLCISGRCAHTPLDMPCEDGSICTRDDRCVEGRCRPGEEMTCAPVGPCTVESCHPVDGCVSTVVDLGVACDDANECTPTSTCDGAGACTGSVACPDDGNECTIETCAGTTCGIVPADSGTFCGDGGQCCDGACVTVQSDPANCGSCGNACGPGESCLAGSCSACSSDASCDDGLSCTQDRCVGTCTHTVVIGCLIGGVCRGNGTSSPVNQCERCDAATSRTAWTAVPDGTSCDDGLFCTELDQCMGGACEGSGERCAGVDPTLCREIRCNETLDRCQMVGGCNTGEVCCPELGCRLLCL